MAVLVLHGNPQTPALRDAPEVAATMAKKDRQDDPLWRAARYRAARIAEKSASGTAESGQDGAPDPEPEAAAVRARIADQAAARADSIVDKAVKRRETEKHALAGRPLPRSETSFDPNWWVKGLIEREQLIGLGPAAYLLRTEDAELDDRLDEEFSEHDVRETLSDFNVRVIDARRQLLGGPPVVTKPRDIEREVERWRKRREARTDAPMYRPVNSTRQVRWWRRLRKGRAQA